MKIDRDDTAPVVIEALAGMGASLHLAGEANLG
jgi:hypothetical protein